MRKKVLLIEDYEEKAQDIMTFLSRSHPEFEVSRCSSYNSAQEMIFEAETEYDLILLDMSMSSYELKDDATGGLPEPSAGQNILVPAQHQHARHRHHYVQCLRTQGTVSLPRGTDSQLSPKLPLLRLLFLAEERLAQQS